MSFSYLPWPVYVVIAIGSAILVLLYIKKIWKSSPKTYSIGLLMTSIGALIAGIIKLTSNLQVFNQYLLLLSNFGMICTSFGIILIVIGSYKKVKDDPEKQKIILILTGVLIITIILVGLIVLT